MGHRQDRALSDPHAPCVAAGGLGRCHRTPRFCSRRENAILQALGWLQHDQPALTATTPVDVSGTDGRSGWLAMAAFARGIDRGRRLHFSDDDLAALSGSLTRFPHVREIRAVSGLLNKFSS